MDDNIKYNQSFALKYLKSNLNSKVKVMCL